MYSFDRLLINTDKLGNRTENIGTYLPVILLIFFVGYINAMAATLL